MDVHEKLFARGKFDPVEPRFLAGDATHIFANSTPQKYMKSSVCGGLSEVRIVGFVTFCYAPSR